MIIGFNSICSSTGAVYHALKDYHLAEKHYKHALALDSNHQGAIGNYNRLLKILKNKKKT